MSDGPAAEPPKGTPSRRALGAMETAVRRAREQARSTGVTTPTAEVPRVPRPAPPPPLLALNDPVTPAPPRSEAEKRERWLIVSVAVVAVLVVAAAIALTATLSSGGPPVAAPPSTAATTTHSGSRSTAPQHGNGHPTKRSSASSTTTTVTAPVPVTGGPPVISSISPATGAAGQGIEIAGSNFLSSDGQIVATFNGQVASTSCPAQNTCTVTVPPMSGAPSAQLVITTANGTSNAVTFTYS